MYKMTSIMMGVVLLAAVASPSIGLPDPTEPTDPSDITQDPLIVERHGDVNEMDWDVEKEITFDVPAGGWFSISVDWNTLELDVQVEEVPVPAGNTAGCAGSPVLYPWAVAPVGVELCQRQFHDWGFQKTLHTGVTDGASFTDGINRDSLPFDRIYIQCNEVGAAVGDWTGDSPEYVQVGCFFSASGLLPPHWTNWDSACGWTGLGLVGVGGCLHVG